MGARIQTAALSVDALIEETRSPNDGALIVFAGTVRRHNDGKEVAAIEYSAYLPVAERQLAAVEREAERRFAVTCCRIRHRIGPMAIGEASILIVVRAPHRGPAYEASRYAIDTVKQTVPIWKLESYTDGTRVHVRGTPLHSNPSGA